MATIILYKKSKRQPCYRLSYRDPQSGKWRQKLLHCSRDAADQIRKEVEAEFTWLDTHPEKRQALETTSKSVKDAIIDFLESKRGTVKAGTIKRSEVALNNFSDFYNGKIEEIDRQLMDSYRAKLLEDRQGRGANAELMHVKVFLRYCAELDWLKLPKIVMAKELPLEVRWLTKKDVKKLKACFPKLAPDEREIAQDIFNLLLQTGARANEIIEVSWNQINLKRRQIKPLDKGNTGKPLYLNQASVSILKKYKENTPQPFMVNYDWFAWRYSKLAKYAKIETNIHDLRRTCGAWLIQAGVDIYRVSKYLRHSSVTVTEKYYLDILPSDLSVLASKMGKQIV